MKKSYRKTVVNESIYSENLQWEGLLGTVVNYTKWWFKQSGDLNKVIYISKMIYKSEN